MPYTIISDLPNLKHPRSESGPTSSAIGEAYWKVNEHTHLIPRNFWFEEVVALSPTGVQRVMARLNSLIYLT